MFGGGEGVTLGKTVTGIFFYDSFPCLSGFSMPKRQWQCCEDEPSLGGFQNKNKATKLYKFYIILPYKILQNKAKQYIFLNCFTQKNRSRLFRKSWGKIFLNCGDVDSSKYCRVFV